MLALRIFIIILSIMVLLVILLLTIPYKYVIESNINENLKLKIEILWLFGLLKVIFINVSSGFQMKIYIINFCIYCNNKNNSKYVKDSHKGISTKISYKDFDADVLKKIYMCIKEIILVIKPDYCNIEGTYGMEDPFLTGTISSIVPIIKSNLKKIKLNIFPAFDKAIVDILIYIEGKILAFKLLFIFIKILKQKDLRNFMLKKNGLRV